MVKKPWGPLQTVFWGLSHSILREKSGHSFFPHWKNCLFFQKIVFWITSQVVEKWSYNFDSTWQKTLWTIISCPVGLWNSIRREKKNGPKCFLHWRNFLYFQKIVFSTKSYVLKYWYYNDHSKFHITLWILTKYWQEFVILDYTRENRPKFFLHCKDCIS